MKLTEETALSKVPEVTLLFWVIKIAATTLGETGGDAVSMSMQLGYLTATAIFAGVFVVAVAAQIKAKGFTPGSTGRPSSPRPRSARPWPISPTARSGSATPGGSSLLLLRRSHIVAGALYRTLGTVSVARVSIAEGRDVLLDHHHVFPDAGHGAR